MSAASTAQVATLHPRQARKPAATPPPRKAKAKATIVPLHGWRNLDEIMRRGLVDARATWGLANGLHELFSIRPADAEEEMARLGRSFGDDGSRYSRQIKCRGSAYTGRRVGCAQAACLLGRERRRKAAERIGWAVCRGGAQ